MKYIAVFLILALAAGLVFSYLPKPPSDNEDPEKDLLVAVNLSCDGNVVTVTDGNGDPLQEADVSVRDTSDGTPLYFGQTDALGQFTFSECGRKVDIKAKKEYYPTKISPVTLISCEECEKCASDEDCELDEYCANGECLPVECDCGIVTTHVCEEYECCTDADCASTQNCVSHVCTNKPPEEPEEEGCGRDAECPETQYCNIPVGAAAGRCEDVVGCGSVVNHTLAAYQCGNATDCPVCPDGYSCVQNACVQDDISCPQTALVGEERTCNATAGGQPCVRCDYVVSDPSGNESAGKTDENGSFTLPFGMQGGYNVSLVRNGKVIKTIPVAVFPAGGEAGKETALFSSGLVQAVLLVLLLLLIGAAIIFLKRRGGEKPTKRRAA